MKEVDDNLNRAIATYEKYGVEMPVPVLTNFIASIANARALGGLIGYRPIELFNKATMVDAKVTAELVNKGYKQYLV